MKNLASVVPGERPIYNIVTANGRPAVLVNVLQQPDGNAVKIADSVNDELSTSRRPCHRISNLSTFYDQSVLVRDSICRRGGKHSDRSRAVGSGADGFSQELAHHARGRSGDSDRRAYRQSSL